MLAEGARRIMERPRRERGNYGGNNGDFVEMFFQLGKLKGDEGY
jgi:hypothetical protein